MTGVRTHTSHFRVSPTASRHGSTTCRCSSRHNQNVCHFQSSIFFTPQETSEQRCTSSHLYRWTFAQQHGSNFLKDYIFLHSVSVMQATNPPNLTPSGYSAKLHSKNKLRLFSHCSGPAHTVGSGPDQLCTSFFFFFCLLSRLTALPGVES